MMRKYSKYTVPLIIVSTMSLGVMAPSIDAKVMPSSAEPSQVTTA
ncbi:hypothetical protein [Staphylococcus hyicus]|nr:hypothetical protein [Staphylococcus hyicus]